MAHIRSFRGILYNPRKIKNIAKVFTEPYDVISSLEQAAYHKSHPYNIIRLILGKRHPADNSKNNRYTRARKYFADWIKKDILLRDKGENIYIYAQTFPHNNRTKTRTGFIILLKIEDFAKNAILPHENTRSYAVQERLKLLQETGANLSPIFALFCEPQGRINKLLSRHKRGQRPCIVIKKDEVLHRIWRMSDKRKITAVQKLLRDKQIFIADGHHRYEAALNYKLQMQKKKRGAARAAPFNYVMTYLVATDDPGLTILPTHRAIKVKGGFKLQEIISKLRKAFELRRFSTSDELFSYMRESPAAARVFGACFGKNKFWGLKLKSAGIVYKIIDEDKQSFHKGLDVSILHSLVIERILNIAPFEKNIYYTRDAQECIKLVSEDKYQAAFFLRPLRVTQVKRAACAGRKMPHKSTYFYPKLLTGLVINKL
ncbi:MAG: DUF1015 domain-containing protein [Candidatus Omnitrophica bacterium]|nr:DUF1015 domain-containing protein [Candidatus Omnitrophota bacterium]